MSLQKEEIKAIQVYLPFTDEELDEYFNHLDEYMFIVNLHQSKYSGEKLLNYIYNSGMNCDIVTEALDEKLEELLLAYIKTDKQLGIPLLADFWCSICITWAGKQMINDTDKIISEYCEWFIERNKDIVEELASVLVSLKYELELEYIPDAKDFVPKIEIMPHRRYEHIGQNFISMRVSLVFWQMLDEIKEKAKIYQYDNFKDFTYDGYQIYHLIDTEFNPLTMFKTLTERTSENEKDN